MRVASGAAVWHLALRIRKIGLSNRRAHAGASKIPAFDTLTVENDMRLMLEDVSRAGCDGGLPRTAHSQNGTSNGRCSLWALGYTYDGHVHHAHIRPLHVEDTSRAGCDLGLPRIAYSQNGTYIK